MGEGVHGEWVQLVNGDEVPPVVGQGPNRLVAFEYVFDEWGSEEGEHGQVGFGVSAVRCRVDKERLDPTVSCTAVVSAGIVQGGFGWSLRDALAEARVPVRCLGVPQGFPEHGDRAAMIARFGYDADGIESAVRELLEHISAR